MAAGVGEQYLRLLQRVILEHRSAWGFDTLGGPNVMTIQYKLTLQSEVLEAAYHEVLRFEYRLHEAILLAMADMTHVPPAREGDELPF